MSEPGAPTVLVRFRVPGDTARCAASGQAPARGRHVVVDSERGQLLGTVIQTDAPGGSESVRPLLREVTPEDLRTRERTEQREGEAFAFCTGRIKALALAMKLVNVEINHSGTRATFYFTSADRVDFRALVRDLATRFHTRIEMRQIGVRDAARYKGGTGLCGRTLCCSTWLPEFQPVSMRMAKDQGLTLNQDKLSGVCGRLRCCLRYEHGLYEEQRKGLPKLGKMVDTPQGPGVVKEVNVLRRQVRVALANGAPVVFDAAEIRRPESGGTQP